MTLNPALTMCATMAAVSECATSIEAVLKWCIFWETPFLVSLSSVAPYFDPLPRYRPEHRDLRPLHVQAEVVHDGVSWKIEGRKYDLFRLKRFGTNQYFRN